MKVMTIVGTRPEIIKLSRVIALLDQQVEHVLVHTGQNYDVELNEIFFKELGIRSPDHYLNAAGTNASETIANVVLKSDQLFQSVKPDAVLLYGDTNSCLSVIPAKRRKIPIFHMEAGNRCFDQRVPEELNRKIVDHLSDINMPLSEHARKYLIAEGIRPETIIKTGSPMKEVIEHHREKIASSDVLKRLGLKANEFFLVSTHREENVDSPENFTNLLNSLNALAEKYGYPLIVSTHPRTRKRLEELKSVQMNPLVQFMKPLGFLDYCHLQLHAKCVLSDSGTITEESSILDFPAIMIREAHERPEGMDEGAVLMAGLKSEEVLAAVNAVTSVTKQNGRRTRIVADYDVTNVSHKVLNAILSYTGYINRTVWKKH